MSEQLDMFRPNLSENSVQLSPPDSEDQTWKTVLQGEREKEYFQSIKNFVDAERAVGKVIYPPRADVYNALAFTPLENVKVVILGQDPYHGPNQAHGLCFSVRPGVASPPSLINIFKELRNDLGIPIAKHGNLESWAHQGVLLLNAVLTVESGKPGSHANRGWEQFTDRIVEVLNIKKRNLVFLLWGAYAQRKGSIIDMDKHTVLKAPHPSPFSADKGFFGCKHFSKANQALEEAGITPINWQLPEL